MGSLKNKKKKKKTPVTRRWAFVKKRRSKNKENPMDQDLDGQPQEEPEDRANTGDGISLIVNDKVDKIGCMVKVLQPEKEFSDSTGTEICPEAVTLITQPVACSTASSRDNVSRSRRVEQPIRTYGKTGTNAGSGSSSVEFHGAMHELMNTRFDDDCRDETCDNDVDELLRKENSSRDSTHVRGNDSVNSDGEDANSDVESEGTSVRHIVDIKYLLRTLHEKMDNHNPDCPSSIRDVNLWKQVDLGMRSQLFFRCRKCEFHCSVWTVPERGDEMSIHEGTVCGSLVAGIGFATIEAQLAAMGIRSMSHVTYRKVRDSLIPHIKNASDREMRDAAEMERTLAIQEGRVTQEGIPYITVIVDGAWGKRSYRGGRYDALSGTAVIVGALTGRVLFCGVRNKYCCICNRSTGLNGEPPIHDCYKNWGQHQSSTSMEPDIIAEGFCSSLETHGLIYQTVVGDGDSSVYQAILDKDPYAAYDVRVKKIECKNHLFRNFCKHITNASEAKFVKKPSSGSVKELRARVKSSGLKMRVFIQAAIERRRAEDSTRAEQAEGLMYDILNMPGHFFGDHSRCDSSSLGCDESETNLVPLLDEVGIFHIIDSVVDRLAKCADSLLENITSNAAGLYHSQGNRFNAGRRVNNSLRSSYELRAHCALVQHNTLALSSKIYASARKRVPRAVLAMERRRLLQVSITKSHRCDNGRKQRRRWYGTDKDYGPSCREPDMSQSKYDAIKAKHFEKLRERQANRRNIERFTANQSDCDLWHTYRRDMLTASTFGEICRMKESTSCSRLVKAIRYPKPLEIADVAAGKEYETKAREQLAQNLGIEISLSGLFIDQNISYLSASPDGLIDADGIVEIKYLAKAAENDLTPEEAVEKFSLYRNFFARNSTEEMNKKHKHFYQVQGQLHIAQREYCIFAIWAPLGMKYVKVFRDDEFWNTEMEPKLTRFYNECMLPEIVDSRQNRHMKIREPQYILLAQEREKAKKVEKQSRNQAASAIVPPLESMEVDSETVVDLSSTDYGARLESPIPCMAVDNSQERLDEEMLVHQLQNISKDAVLANVRQDDAFLDDESIQYFLDIVAENCDYNIIPVVLFGYQNVLKPSDTEHDLSIIGGNQFQHWCCIRCEQTTIFVYDSIGRRSYAALSENEKTFIQKRYPKIRMNNIVFPDVATQPDDVSCGVYAAAFATAVALGQDPSDPKHVKNGSVMRQHMARIIQLRELLLFPTEM